MGRIKKSIVPSTTVPGTFSLGNDDSCPAIAAAPSQTLPGVTISSGYRDNTMNHQKLKHHVRHMRNTLYSEPLDLACASYAKIQEEGASLVRALLTPMGPDETDSATQPSLPHSAAVKTDDQDSKVSQQYIADVQAWKKCLEDLAAMLRAKLERTGLLGSPEGVGQNQPSRSDRQMSNERHMRYKRIQQDLEELNKLLDQALTGIAPTISQETATTDYVIARRGDAILQFENARLAEGPILRFRVSSHMLRETSPIFARMFFAQPDDLELDHLDMEEDVSSELPPKPNKFTCTDGSTAMLYRMPQLELNKERTLELLLHAAHMHNDRIPRSLTFEQLVALAETCLRYRCTAPVEFPFEHLWLEQWIHYAASGPDIEGVVSHGMLLISYAFGLRRLFTRTTKTAILFLRGDEDIEAQSSWPPELKKRIAAMCETKRAQIYEACAAAVQECLPPPVSLQQDKSGKALESRRDSSSAESQGTQKRYTVATIANSTITLSADNATRCPAGNTGCDAANLGWLVIGLSQRGLLPYPSFAPYQQSPSAPREPPPVHPPGRSVSDLIDALRTIPPPPQQPAHPLAAACDPTRALRDFANDMYNSVSGLTLFQASGGRSHGWALSRRKRHDPQRVLSVVMNGGRRTSSTSGEEVPILRAGSRDVVDEQVVEEMKAMRLGKGVVGSDDDDDEDWTMTAGQGKEEQRQDVNAVTMMMQSATLREEQISEDEEGTTGKMTKEEAYKILWPEEAKQDEVIGSPLSATENPPPPPFPLDGETDVGREKFLAHDTVLHISEAKMLVSIDGKQLRGERDEMVGLIPKEPSTT